MTESDAFRILRSKFPSYVLTIHSLPDGELTQYRVTLEHGQTLYASQSISPKESLQNLLIAAGYVFKRKNDRLLAYPARERRAG